jgi:thiosulfate dehydrogenase (quinone) large subunit
MTQIRHRHEDTTDLSTTLVESDVVTSATARKGLAVLRIGYAVTFLWAFFDKLLALGFSTGAITNEQGVKTGTDFMAQDAAWLNGGSPTEGFLTFGVPANNPFKDIFNSMAGQPVWDWLFMLGLLGIGLALFTGIGMRFAAAAGALLYMLMYAASLPLTNNPVVDDHLIGAIVLVVLALTLAGDTWGAGRAWARTHLVSRYPVLR